MEFENIKELVSLVDQSSLKEFEYVKDGTSLRLSKNTTPSFAKETMPTEAATETITMQTTPVAEQETSEVVERASTAPEGKVVTSPIVGVVYLQPNPDSDYYVSEGEEIVEGQVVCLIEAMKIMNEIKSEYNGKIVEVLVENEEVVEYNQPLFRIV
ncbi:acetyl-CoA carboxylase biotin carboxyl carrier protein [Jeotgalibaca ciconiae]|uniref:Biotin carboxyl carrier protein of acetyl-CoA carboxylase n=1 Tax=Jeotgalibaca ciconiae TaxID=2496265 RepID=A0A3S9HDQ0_9LACT|nr:acetyl-CoA carboxylase biotin carboxyl carrier protein [Jeotgalibaca ciconiae]AZP05480.1 acetyl-CoA carboxylase biotin carboxyl carrier protein [Jeotgalibaca ciconiae]HJB24573.1 acetyl-CoA carboxylase biotin carboxyl carrier protein [Candidatus Jeotgalibaca pullicola]